jgi:hypothetical protein
VKRFGKEGEFAVIRYDSPHVAHAGKLLAELVEQKILPEIVPFSCYRVAFVRQREDGQMFEEFCDYQIGDGERLQAQKAGLIDKRFTHNLSVERCGKCGCEFTLDSFVAWHHGRGFCLRVECLKVVVDPAHPPPHRRAGAFASGGTFDTGAPKHHLRTHIEAIDAELVDAEIDSSLADENISLQPIEDGVRTALRRAAEGRAKWASEEQPTRPETGGYL